MDEIQILQYKFKFSTVNKIFSAKKQIHKYAQFWIKYIFNTYVHINPHTTHTHAITAQNFARKVLPFIDLHTNHAKYCTDV